MKAFLKIVAFATLFLFLFSAVTSCRVIYPNRPHDNGKHKGWYKKSKRHPKKKKRDNLNQNLAYSQVAEHPDTVASYFDWSQKSTSKTGELKSKQVKN